MSASRLVRRPPARKWLESHAGHGGPQPGTPGLLGPIRITNPFGPGSAPANAAGNAAQQALQDFEAKLGEAVKAAISKALPAGEVALGLLLLIVGVLLATGQGRQLGRMGRAARGFVR